MESSSSEKVCIFHSLITRPGYWIHESVYENVRVYTTTAPLTKTKTLFLPAKITQTLLLAGYYCQHNLCLRPSQNFPRGTKVSLAVASTVDFSAKYKKRKTFSMKLNHFVKLFTCFAGLCKLKF